MIRSLFLAVMMAGPVMAQPVPPKPAPVDVREQLFLSPAGELFKAELGAPYPVDQWFAGADQNIDGRVDWAEFLADGKRYFSDLDRDGSGTLEMAEVDAYELDVLQPIRSGQHPRGMGMMPKPPENAGKYGLIYAPHPIKAADRDMNARVSWPEFQYVLDVRFRALDKESLGYLQIESLPKTAEQQALEARAEQASKVAKKGKGR